MIDSIENRRQQQQQQQRRQRMRHHQPHANCCCHTNGYRSPISIDAYQSHQFTHPTFLIHIFRIVFLAVKQISCAFQTIGKHANNHVKSTNQCYSMGKDNVNIDSDTKLLPNAARAMSFLMSIFTNVGQITYNSEHCDTIGRLRFVNAVPAIGNGGNGCGSDGSGGRSSFKPSKHTLLLLTMILMCLPVWSCQASTTGTIHHLKHSANTVKTKYGELRGLVVRNNPTVEAYLGVPYATPPTGSLRFVLLLCTCYSYPIKCMSSV